MITVPYSCANQKSNLGMDELQQQKNAPVSDDHRSDAAVEIGPAEDFFLCRTNPIFSYLFSPFMKTISFAQI